MQDATAPNAPTNDPQREAQYFELIERLLKCPNGSEPEILDASAELLDAEFVRTLARTAAAFAHQGNNESAQFLFFLTRQLGQELGFYTPPSS